MHLTNTLHGMSLSHAIQCDPRVKFKKKTPRNSRIENLKFVNTNFDPNICALRSRKQHKNNNSMNQHTNETVTSTQSAGVRHSNDGQCDKWFVILSTHETCMPRACVRHLDYSIGRMYIFTSCPTD